MTTPIAARTAAGWEALQQTLLVEGGSEPFSGRWPRWGTWDAGAAYAAAAPPERHTSVGGCSSSPLLPTPTARLGPRGMPNRQTAQRRLFEEGRRHLEDAIALLPTPRTSDARGPGEHGDGGVDLRTAVTLLPTPRQAAARTSRAAALRRDSRSAPSLEQAIELAEGTLPREFEDWADLPPSWTGAGTRQPSGDGRLFTETPPDPETTGDA